MQNIHYGIEYERYFGNGAVSQTSDQIRRNFIQIIKGVEVTEYLKKSFVVEELNLFEKFSNKDTKYILSYIENTIKECLEEVSALDVKNSLKALEGMVDQYFKSKSDDAEKEGTHYPVSSTTDLLSTIKTLFKKANALLLEELATRVDQKKEHLEKEIAQQEKTSVTLKQHMDEGLKNAERFLTLREESRDQASHAELEQSYDLFTQMIDAQDTILSCLSKTFCTK